jgi:hypothetical protein
VARLFCPIKKLQYSNYKSHFTKGEFLTLRSNLGGSQQLFIQNIRSRIPYIEAIYYSHLMVTEKVIQWEKLFFQQAVEANTVVGRRGSHIFLYTRFTDGGGCQPTLAGRPLPTERVLVLISGRTESTSKPESRWWATVNWKIQWCHREVTPGHYTTSWFQLVV